MKGLYWGLGLLFIMSSFYMGQNMEEAPSKKFDYGVKAGLNIAFIPDIFEEIKESNSKIRFNAGIFANFKIASKWQIQPELEYSLQGMEAIFIYKNGTFTEGIDVHGDLKINYLKIPVYLRFAFDDHWYISGGAYFAWVVKNHIHIYTADWVEEQYGVNVDEEGTFNEVAQTLRDNGYNINAESQKYDFGLTGDIGYIFSNKIGLNLRYSQGITKVIKGTEERIKGSPRNQVFFFGADYRF